jgi:DNA polymerase I
VSTSSLLLNYFREVVLVDTEFRPRGDGTQEVRCVCALELASGREHRLWCDGPAPCPYPIDDDSLFVAHYASAELISHDSLGWVRPKNILDTCVEFSAMTAGRRRKDQGRGLSAALTYFSLPHIDQEEKDEMRDLALVDKRNYEFGAAERAALLDYCWSDIAGTAALLTTLEDFLCL